jgi:predicted TIM-barrel fold metal-dependent hydrolase
VIVDAQVHVWAADSPERPWIPGGADYAHSATPLTADDLLVEMDRVGVQRAFLVSPTWEGDRNDVVTQAAEDHPDRFTVIARFDIRDDANARLVREWSDDGRVSGVRAVFARRSESWLRDGSADWLWLLLTDLAMPVMIFAPYQYEGVARLAAQYPSLKIAICHFGMDTRLRDAEIPRQVDALLPLSSHPNVAVKATSLPSFFTQPYPYPSLQRELRRVVEAFGAERVFWGSDLSRLRCDYQDLYRLFTEELDFLSPRDLEMIMGRAVCNWFDWPIDNE